MCAIIITYKKTLPYMRANRYYIIALCEKVKAVVISEESNRL
jgi:hypothetical protein